MYRVAVLSLLFLFSICARAEFQWSDNFTWNRARLIDPGQNSWSFRTSYQQFDSRFGSSGATEQLGQPFSRTWTWQQLMSVASAEDRQQLSKYMQATGAKPESIAAATTFQLRQQETTLQLAWAYGLTSHWMIGLSAPLSLIDTQIEPHTAVTPQLAAAFKGRSPMADTATQAKVAALVRDQLASEGYSPVQTRTQSMLVGDVSLLNQFGLWQDADWAFSIQQIVKMPSPPSNSAADYVRYSRGDGAVDFGLNALADRKWRRFLFGVKAGYLKALPDSQKMRVPSSDGGSTRVVDRSVHRNLGDLISTEVETFYNLSKRWSANVAYLGFFKGSDKYSGDNGDAAYWLMSEDSAEELHIARAGLSYVIGAPTERHGIQRRWVASANFYQPVAGRNISEGPEGALELQAMF